MVEDADGKVTTNELTHTHFYIDKYQNPIDIDIDMYMNFMVKAVLFKLLKKMILRRNSV